MEHGSTFMDLVVMNIVQTKLKIYIFQESYYILMFGISLCHLLGQFQWGFHRVSWALNMLT